MSDWTEAVDKKSGKTYYYNKQTKETRWTKPEIATAGNVEDEATNNPANWVSSTDKSSGKKYYYNKVTKETRWSKPSCFSGDADAVSVDKKDMAANDEADLGDPRKWKRVIDKKTAKAYYYNSETKQTSWKKPKGFDQITNEAAEAAANATPQRQAVDVPVASPKKEIVQMSAAPSNANERRMQELQKQSSVSSLHSDAKNGGGDESDGNTSGDDDVDKGSDGDGDGKKGDDEEMKDGEHKFRLAKHRHGYWNRLWHTGETVDQKKLLSFKKSLIKKSLLKQNREYDAEAVQSFKNIMSYMGDRRSHKPDWGHAKKIIQNGLTAPETLRDEIYLQICKQVTNHPSLEHTIKGWTLMCVLLGCFPVSQSMKTFLEDFIERTRKDENSDGEIKKLGKQALDRLEKIMVMGPRAEVPSIDEIKRDQEGNPVSLKVYTLDNAIRTIEVDCFTQVKEVKRNIIQKAGLSYSVPFAIYEFSKDNDERILDDESRILDVIASWERIISEKKITTVEPFRLVFKAELVLKTTDKNLIEDEEALNLMYIQAVHDVVSERYPAEPNICPSLAALQLQATFGDYNSNQHNVDFVSDRLGDLLPAAVLGGGKKKSPQVVAEMAQKVITKYTKLQGVSANEAKLSYLDYVQEWALYGACFITVEQKQLKDYPPYIRVAVTCDAILLVHPESKDVLDTFGYHEIVTWGYSDEKFILVVGNLVQQRKLFFKTNRGKFMNKLVHDYVKTKVPQA